MRATHASTPPGSESLPDWIDDVADRFEAQWRQAPQAPRPKLADFLGACSGEPRRALLHELIEIDLEYRRRLGERASWRDYQEQFPELAQAALDAYSSGVAQVAQTSGERLPRLLGRFELRERLGDGSFGTVYRAHDAKLNRQVAVKVPRRGSFADREDEQRFMREAQSAARLRHHGIVPVHEIAVIDGVPCIVSDYIEGRTLAQEMADGRPEPRRAAELIAQIADALDCAHRHGVIHRDIKPHNILVDAAGRPHLTDFGLARREEASVALTREGQVLGTPAYMSPEQARGLAHAVDGRSDVYSLGVVFYQLLTGETPFRGSLRLLLLQVLHDEPRPPRRLSDAVPRDLETICLKAMAKEPAARYESAAALADDLRRWLAGTPIYARPCGALERWRRWCRRNPVLSAWIAFAVLSLLTGTAVSAYFIGRSIEQQRETERAQERTQTETRLSDRRWYLAEMRLARPYWEGNQVRWLRETLAGQRPERTGGIDLRGFEWFYWQRLCSFPREFAQQPSALATIAISPDGQRLAAAGDDGAVSLWHAPNGTKIKTLVGHTGIVSRIAFHPDGTRLASASDDHTVRIWDLAAGREAIVFRAHEQPVGTVAFSPDGQRVASSGNDARVLVWDATTGKVCFVVQRAATGLEPAFSPNGRWLAVGCCNDGSVRLFDAADGREIRTFQGSCPRLASLAFSPDSNWLAGAGGGPEVIVWDARSGERKWSQREHTAYINRVVYSPDGSRLATASSDRTIRLWDAATGQTLRVLQGHTDYVRGVAFDRSGETLASCGHDGAVYLWDLTCDPEVLRLGGHPTEVNGVAFSPDGKRLAAACGTLDAPTEEVKIWDVTSGKEACSLRGHRRGVNRVSFSHDGQWLASASDDHTVGIWRTDGGKLETFVAGHQEPVWGAVFSPGDRRLASASADGTVKLWDLLTHRIVWSCRPGVTGNPAGNRGLAVLGIAFSADGSRLAVSQNATSDQIRILDAATGQEQLILRGHTDAVWSVAFSHDDRVLASASNDGTVRLWDAETGAALRVLKGHTRQISDVAFSPDGKRAASASWDGTVKLWDVHSGQETLILPSRSGRIFSVAFSRDGQRLAAGCRDNAVRIWEAPRDR